jgi:hypothetical protein
MLRYAGLPRFRSALTIPAVVLQCKNMTLRNIN